MATGHPFALFFVTVFIAVSISAGLVNGQQKDEYHIDVLVYVDFAFYENWLKETNMTDSPQALEAIKEYIAYLFQGVNRRYRSITNLPFNINVHVSQVEIARTQQEANWTESVKTDTGSSRPQVNATAVLENLNQFVTDRYSTLPAFDHLMLFTRYDLVGNVAIEGKYTTGLAYVGTICTNSSVSIIEDDGGAVSEATAAHELAHSLGAYHDGNNNDCSASDLFAMTNLGANPAVNDARKKLNLWTFSNCSSHYFNDTVQKLKTKGLEKKCLLTKVPPEDVPPVPDNLPSPPDQQCRHIYNDSSYLCRMPYDPPNSSLADLCLEMSCYNPYLAGEKCTVHTADAGTCCGQGKWCQQGRCVENQLNSKCSNINDSCPFGDQPANVKFRGTSRTTPCDELENGYCYQKPFRAKCCEHCEKYRTNDVGCLFGDRVLHCSKDGCPTNSSLVSKDCCQTCQTTTSTPTPTTATTTYTTTVTAASTTTTPTQTTTTTVPTTTTTPTKTTTTTVPTTTPTKTTTTTVPTTTTTPTKTTTTTVPTTTTTPTKTTTTTVPTTTPTKTTTTTVPTTTTTPTKTTTTTVPTTTTTPTKTTTTTVPTTTTIKTTTREATTSKPTSTKASAIRDPQCIPLLGVRTCGCAALTTNLALLLTAMALIVVITM